MNDNEATAADNPDSLTTPARKGIPLASAFHLAAAANPNRTGVSLATMFRQITTAAPAVPGIPRDAVSPQKVSVFRHRQRVLSRSVAYRTRRRLIDRRFTRRDREAAQQARRPPSRESIIRGRFLARLSEPAGSGIRDFIANVMAPFEKLQRMLAEMIRPSWLRAFEEMQERLQRLVQNPMRDALRRIQEQIADYAWPTISVTQRMRDNIIGSSNLFARAFRHARDWASGFMTYQAKLRQQINAMFSSWNWTLPDITAVFQPITNILRIVRSIESPGLSSMTEALTQLAIRAVFRAAVRVRKAIIQEENSEKIVREFMLQVLDLFPKGEPHVEAAKEALLEDAWTRAEPENVKKVLRKRITELHRNHRLIGTTELGHHHIVSLQAPSDRARSDSGVILTLENALADPCAVEDLVLGLPKFRDPRIDRVLRKLKPGERKVADLYAGHDGMTWDRAAAAAGQSPAFGERVRRKLLRLGNDFDSRQANGRHVPTTTRPRTKPAFV
ncbi:hypothetical protein ABZ749_23650 [Micromonospora sp. NPDC047753]|uniref:hypothetical protein n=1 Tax=Micromonospora sp. NPDC047753 TaxID=3154817 RepID=UPI0033C10E47